MTTDAHDTGLVGRRLREIRVWRGLSVRALADLSGKSKSFLSDVENGMKPLNSRVTLQAVADALRVAPSELTALDADDVRDNGTGPIIVDLRLALAEADIGDPVDAEPPPWPDVAAGVDAVNGTRARGDFAELARLLPALVLNLHAHLDGPRRTDALTALVDVYTAARVAAKALVGPDLAQIAARHVADAAAALSGPEWEGLAGFNRAQAISHSARARTHAIATRTADAIAGHLDDGRVAQVYGTLHLTASLAAVTLGRPDTAQDHVAEAAEIADRAGVVGPGHGRLWFGRANVDIWRTTLAVEQGEAGRALEIARGIDPSTLPASPARQSSLWTDIGRALALERKGAEAVRAFLRAEELAPQRLRAEPFAREVSLDLMRRAKRDAGGRELRGLVSRMGMAV